MNLGDAVPFEDILMTQAVASMQSPARLLWFAEHFDFFEGRILKGLLASFLSSFKTNLPQPSVDSALLFEKNKVTSAQ